MGRPTSTSFSPCTYCTRATVVSIRVVSGQARGLIAEVEIVRSKVYVTEGGACREIPIYPQLILDFAFPITTGVSPYVAAVKRHTVPAEIAPGIHSASPGTIGHNAVVHVNCCVA